MDQKEIKKFVAVGDLHVGWEKNTAGKLVPTHNITAWDAFEEFVEDYQPDIFLLMGDVLHAGEISHWERNKKLATEGRKLSRAIKCFKESYLDELWLPEHCQKIFVEGNHDKWIRDIAEDYPGLEGLLDPADLYGLRAEGWECHPMGTTIRLGKLDFIHGENILLRGDYAYNAVVDRERSVRIWHTHSYKAATKNSSVDAKEVKTGVCVPGMCNRAPSYGGKAPNKWSHGFLYGCLAPNGYFTDQVVMITDRGFWLNGKQYRG